MTYRIQVNRDFQTGDRWALWVDGKKVTTGQSPEVLKRYVGALIAASENTLAR